MECNTFELIPVCVCVFWTGFRTEGLPSTVWQGGESEALERLSKHLDKKVVCCLRVAVTGLQYNLC